jgi:hypothetical protein
MKLSSIRAHVAAKVLGRNPDNFVCHPTNSTRGGILLGWQSALIEGLHPRIDGFSLSMTARPQWLGHALLLTSVYIPSKDDAKLSFLDELWSLKPSGAIPWIVIGDFNLIYKAQDKNNLNHRLMGCFWHCLNYCELSEFALQNKRFTWSNERVHPTLVRLDRVFCNKDWELLFLDYMLQALSSSLSDHCPIILCPE